MRTIVDIPEYILEDVEVICKKEKISRAELMRRALKKFCDSQRSSENNTEEAFGLFKNHKIDGLQYQQNVRSEW